MSAMSSQCPSARRSSGARCHSCCPHVKGRKPGGAERSTNPLRCIIYSILACRSSSSRMKPYVLARISLRCTRFEDKTALFDILGASLAARRLHTDCWKLVVMLAKAWEIRRVRAIWLRPHARCVTDIPCCTWQTVSSKRRRDAQKCRAKAPVGVASRIEIPYRWSVKLTSH